jgi:hypothetical protein
MVKGTTASSPASIILRPGDRLQTANGMNLEMWGKHRIQDVRVLARPRAARACKPALLHHVLLLWWRHRR